MNTEKAKNKFKIFKKKTELENMIFTKYLIKYYSH